MPFTQEVETKSYFDLYETETIDGLDYESIPVLSSDEQIMVNYVNQRYNAMKVERSKEDYKWDMRDMYTRARVEVSTDGKARVNMPIEQNLIELYI